MAPEPEVINGFKYPEKEDVFNKSKIEFKVTNNN